MDVQVLAERPHVTGSRAALKAVEKGQAAAVFVAADAQTRVTLPIRDACARHNITIIEVPTMLELGRAAKLQVPAAAAVLLK